MLNLTIKYIPFLYIFNTCILFHNNINNKTNIKFSINKKNKKQRKRQCVREYHIKFDIINIDTIKDCTSSFHVYNKSMYWIISQSFINEEINKWVYEFNILFNYIQKIRWCIYKFLYRYIFLKKRKVYVNCYDIITNEEFKNDLFSINPPMLKLLDKGHFYVFFASSILKYINNLIYYIEYNNNIHYIQPREIINPYTKNKWSWNILSCIWLIINDKEFKLWKITYNEWMLFSDYLRKYFLYPYETTISRLRIFDFNKLLLKNKCELCIQYVTSNNADLMNTIFFDCMITYYYQQKYNHPIFLLCIPFVLEYIRNNKKILINNVKSFHQMITCYNNQLIILYKQNKEYDWLFIHTNTILLSINFLKLFNI